MKRLVVILLTSLIGVVITSCYTLDTISDISISLQQPETIIIKNTSYVSTLNSIKFEIKRNNKTVYTYEDECLVIAGENVKIILDDFIIQDGDIGVIISGNLSWSM
jgi:ribonuclease HIII